MEKTVTDHNEQLTKVKAVLIDALNPVRIYLFGSRASGDYKFNSDYDIAVEGTNASFRTIRKAKAQLDETLGIFSFDLIQLEEVSREFAQIVKEKGKLIYERD